MKLLIVTQAVDTEHPILGFFCGWLAEFSKRAERITVIANEVGAHALPPNVSVHSLGKERASSRFGRVVRYLRFIWTLRHDYNAILVHMTPEHAVLAAPLALLLRKRLFLWYNHPARGVFLRLALLCAERVFYTSPESASAASPRAERMPVGIDVDLFSPGDGAHSENLIYMQGRVSASKRVDVALEALRTLRARGTDAHLRIVGPAAEGYLVRLRTEAKDLFDGKVAEIGAALPNRLTPAEFRRAAVVVNLAREGHFDKSALEAMACGTPVIVGSRTFEGLVPGEWIIDGGDSTALAVALERFFKLSPPLRHTLGLLLRERVAAEHGLPALAERLFGSIASPESRMDPKRFYDSVSPRKFGVDYEKARWDSSAIARSQYAMTADALRRFAVPRAQSAASVIELGPGPGTWTKLFIERNPRARYTLVDISTAMLDQARSALPSENITFVESDWLKLKTTSPVDYFFSSRAIEYVSDKEAAARVVAEALKSGGAGAIVTKMPKPFFDALRGRDEALHQGQVSPPELRHALEAAGLRVTGTTIVTATLPLIRSARANAALYAGLKLLPLVFPLTLFAESYAVSFEKP